MTRGSWIGLGALILAAAVLAHFSCPTCQQRLATGWDQLRGWWWRNYYSG